MQNPLFIESLEEAVEATAARVGGKKALACVMRPDLCDDPDAAHRWLLDALNPDRRTELHAIHIQRACIAARKVHCHVLKHWFDEATGYEPSTIAASKTKSQVRADELQRAIAEVSRLANEHAAAEKAEEAEKMKPNFRN